MKTRFIWFIAVMLFVFLNTAATGNEHQEDKAIFDQIIFELQANKEKSTAELVVKAGQLLMNTPYAAHTLETEPEQLIINLRELDCTTFAENCLALARTAKTKKPSFQIFKNELQLIRYRGGVIDGYPSRLHYFSEWILDNAKKQTTKSVSKLISDIKFSKNINFMSHHPNSYKPLKDNTVFIETISKQESDLSKSELYYIPTEKLESVKNKIEDGDIFGITTHIDGLDIMHVGIAVFKDNELHFMHASSKAEKVILSEETLYEYLAGQKSATGIMIARPI